MERGTIKLPEDEYERHNERRQALGLTWAEYIEGNAPDALERQAAALEVIAGMLMLRFEYLPDEETGNWNPESLYKEAQYYGQGGEL